MRSQLWIVKSGVPELSEGAVYYCSKCDLEVFEWARWHYCPNCGSEMINHV